MSKKQHLKPQDIEKNIMSRVRSKTITMKPKWYFVLGSIFMIIGLISFSLIGVFLTNLTFFLTRQHGPMGQWRLEQILNSFPLWVPLIAIVGIVFGILFLKKYDFSYKKNFSLIVLGFILTIIVIAFILDISGLDNIWMMRQPMRRFQQQNYNYEGQLQNGMGRRMMQKL